MLSADYHVHTHFSADSRALPEDCVERAVRFGLGEIAFTDHLDFRYRTLDPYPYIDVDAYVRRVLELREEYAGRIKVVLGLELGLTPEIAHLARTVTDRHPYDFIICSTHDIKGEGVYGSYFDRKKKRAAYDGYFKEALSVIRSGAPFSVYGHLDFIERYGPYEDPIVYYKDHADVLDAVFKALIEGGRGLEVNTSGFRYGFPHTNPKPELLCRYRELGGKILTVGSDAHRSSDIARDFDAAKDMLVSLGFRYVTLYEKMTPKMKLL